MRLGPRGNLVLFALCVPSASPLAYTHPHRRSGSLDLSPFNSDGGKVEGKYTRKQFVRRFFCIPATFVIKKMGEGLGWSRQSVLGSTIAGGYLKGWTDQQLVLQLLDQMTLCLTPCLTAELFLAHPLLADKQRIVSLSAHLPPFPACGEGDEQMKVGKTEWQVKGERQCQKER